VSADWISLRGVRATGYHGVFEHERRDGQEFVVDLDVSLDLERAGASDHLADTLDYGALAAGVVERIEGEPFDLIERLATVIADDVRRDPRVEQVRVTVHKPQAPVGVPFGDVAVTVTRQRGSGAPAPVVIAVGANLPRDGESPEETVEAAVAALEATPGVVHVTVSALFDTDPVGGPADQPVYVNAVVVARTTLAPRALLEALHGVEARFGRTRDVRWGPRTLDLDLVQYGDPAAGTDVVSDDPSLTLPHPRAHERGFVLVPWVDVDPDAVLRHGDGTLAVRDLAASSAAGVRRRAVAEDGGR
jgi:dihydroneopterin aldolase/2-amino-4-hydroxy-6-hydroxymethyldihydropteridine diphosphokinase